MSNNVNHNLSPGKITCCQICGSEDLELVFDFGFHPPCDSLLTSEQLDEPEMTFPLRLVVCKECTLSQIDHVVDPKYLFFPEYPYRSGITETLSNNLQAISTKLKETYGLEEGSLAVDLGSNDGTILKGFKKNGLRVQGVEPTNIANLAIEDGIPTIQKFFDTAIAEEILEESGQAAVVTASNMFAHVAQLGELITGVEKLLQPEGIFVTESHYLIGMIDTVQYDAIYHEHLKYYSLTSLVRLFGYYEFTVIDVEEIENYGGSIRVVAKKGKGWEPSSRVTEMLEREASLNMGSTKYYSDFCEKIVRHRVDLTKFLLEAKEKGERVVGVGCPGRAATLLNYCGIDPSLVDCIAEQETSLKLGMYAPGAHLEIRNEMEVFAEKPDHALMLSWHYADAIVRNIQKKGFTPNFVVPLPEVREV